MSETNYEVNFTGTGLTSAPAKKDKTPAALADGAGNGARQPPTVINDDFWSDTAGRGWEDVEGSEFGRPPVLRILQTNSPEVMEGEAKYIPGARAGMIISSGTRDIWDLKNGGIFIPVARDHYYTQWRPRDAGGGMAGEPLSPSDPNILAMRREQGSFGKLKLEGGNEAVQTYYMYGLFIPPGSNDGEPLKVALPFTSTQIKKYNVMMQKLATRIGRPPKFPLWAHRWRIATQPEKNSKGSFYGWRLEWDGGSANSALLNPRDPIVGIAEEFNEQARLGNIKADWGQTTTHTDDDAMPF
jgi:hypothetical protein